MDKFVLKFSSSTEYENHLKETIFSSQNEKDIWNSLFPPSTQSNRKPVGRPKSIREKEDQQTLDDITTPKRTHIDWFSSPLIHDIIAAHKICKTGYETVKYLKQKYPKMATEKEGRFDSLRHSTIDSWFQENEKLHPKYEQKLLFMQTMGPNKKPGPSFLLQSFPQIENSLITSLNLLRNQGVCIRSHQIRCIFKALCMEFRNSEENLLISQNELERLKKMEFASLAPGLFGVIIFYIA